MLIRNYLTYNLHFEGNFIATSFNWGQLSNFYPFNVQSSQELGASYFQKVKKVALCFYFCKLVLNT